MITTKSRAVSIAIVLAGLAAGLSPAAAQNSAPATSMEDCMAKARAETDPAKRRQMEEACGGSNMGTNAMGGTMQPHSPGRHNGRFHGRQNGRDHGWNDGRNHGWRHQPDGAEAAVGQTLSPFLTR